MKKKSETNTQALLIGGGAPILKRERDGREAGAAGQTHILGKGSPTAGARRHRTQYGTSAKTSVKLVVVVLAIAS
jgi:hypothetical protein